MAASMARPHAKRSRVRFPCPADGVGAAQGIDDHVGPDLERLVVDRLTGRGGAHGDAFEKFRAHVRDADLASVTVALTSEAKASTSRSAARLAFETSCVSRPKTFSP